MTQPIVRKPVGEGEERTGFLARFALALTAWTERWVPDAFIFALLATVIVVVAGAGRRRRRRWRRSSTRGASGFWELIPFTLQMALIIITGHVLATSPPMGRLIRMAGGVAATPRGAVALVTFFALVELVVQLGLQPDLQRRARARGRAARARASTTARWPPPASSASAASGRRA